MDKLQAIVSWATAITLVVLYVCIVLLVLGVTGAVIGAVFTAEAQCLH